jgi:hypothetical protein
MVGPAAEAVVTDGWPWLSGTWILCPWHCQSDTSHTGFRDHAVYLIISVDVEGRKEPVNVFLLWAESSFEDAIGINQHRQGLHNSNLLYLHSVEWAGAVSIIKLKQVARDLVSSISVSEARVDEVSLTCLIDLQNGSHDALNHRFIVNKAAI